jgi:ubiquinone/menaquinone biosynthesis C-methylase UbiE
MVEAVLGGDAVAQSTTETEAEAKMFAASAGYERFMGRWSRLLAPLYVSFAGVKNGDRVLDVGTGTGSVAAAVEASMPASEIVGIDPSSGFIAYAQKNAKSTRARFEVGDGQALKFKDPSFDHTMALLVMNFIPDHNKAIAEMRRVTRSQGIVRTPHSTIIGNHLRKAQAQGGRFRCVALGGSPPAARGSHAQAPARRPPGLARSR